jgi:hypothetical protein
MGWSILAAVPLLALLALWLLRFRYRIEFESPAGLRMSGGIHFLAWKKLFAFDLRRLLDGRDKADAADAPPHAAAEPPAFPAGGQAGAVRIPEVWAARIVRIRKRFHEAGRKWILTPAVWKSLAAYVWGSGRRLLRLARPRLQEVHIGLENAYDLARVASVWSVGASALPALACPVTYGFAVRGAELRFRLAGGFSALELAWLGMASLGRFPWRSLAQSFIRCWRDPSLSRWQRRVLLP